MRWPLTTFINLISCLIDPLTSYRIDYSNLLSLSPLYKRSSLTSYKLYYCYLSTSITLRSYRINYSNLLPH